MEEFITSLSLGYFMDIDILKVFEGVVVGYLLFYIITAIVISPILITSVYKRIYKQYKSAINKGKVDEKNNNH